MNVGYFIILILFGIMCMVSGYAIGKERATREIMDSMIERINIVTKNLK